MLVYSSSPSHGNHFSYSQSSQSSQSSQFSFSFQSSKLSLGLPMIPIIPVFLYMLIGAYSLQHIQHNLCIIALEWREGLINWSRQDHFVIEMFGKKQTTTQFLGFYIIIKLDLRRFLPVGLSTSLWWKREMKDRGKEVYTFARCRSGLWVFG